MHFISGLPRSGSTMIAPAREATGLVTEARNREFCFRSALRMGKMSGASEFSVFFDDDRRKAILKGVFGGYYVGVPPDCVVFDTNRTWTARASLLAGLYP
jgi:sulfotransferase